MDQCQSGVGVDSVEVENPNVNHKVSAKGRKVFAKHIADSEAISRTNSFWPDADVEDIPDDDVFASTAENHPDNNAGPNLTHNTQADLPEEEESVMERQDVTQNQNKKQENEPKIHKQEKSSLQSNKKEEEQ